MLHQYKFELCADALQINSDRSLVGSFVLFDDFFGDESVCRKCYAPVGEIEYLGAGSQVDALGEIAQQEI